jgi:predicted nucleotidyltransferase
MTLPAEVDRVVTRYLALIDAAAPGMVEGLYLVGSVALDDFHPRSSDVDFIAVSSEPVNEDARQALASVHADLAAEAGRPVPRRIAGGWARRWADGAASGRRPTHS